MSDIATIVDEIRGLSRRRDYFMRLRIAAEHQLSAFIRLNPDEDHKALTEISHQASAPLVAQEAALTKEMERLAKQLPVWQSFGEQTRGFGARSLAVIVGEAGDLGAYASKSKLWKRMGLAVIEGRRQGAPGPSASKDDWITHGYNAFRRSKMFVIGDVLVKVGDHYRKVYLARKEYERARAVAAGLIVAPSAKIPKKRAAEFMSDGHIHHRAQRYMEKRLLRDLRQAWRNEGKAKDEKAIRPTGSLPTPQMNEREATLTAPGMASAALLTAQP